MYSQSTCTVDMALIFIQSENYVDARNIDAKCETSVAGVTLNCSYWKQVGSHFKRLIKTPCFCMYVVFDDISNILWSKF